MTGRALLLAMTGVLAVVTAMDASAARSGLRIDQDKGNYEFTGQAWDPLFNLDLTTEKFSLEIELGFTIDIGGTPYDSIFINEDGYLSVGSAVEITDPTNLPDLVIAPFFADLESITPSTPGGVVNTSFEPETVSYSTGILNRQNDNASFPLPPLDPALDQEAIRITWNRMITSDPTLDPFSFDSAQIIFIDTDGDTGGAFDLELNYSGFLAPLPLLAGFHLGDRSFDLLDPTIADPFSADAAWTFHFGTATPPPTNVPEPGTLSLLLGGLLLVAGGHALRRRRQPVRI